MRTLKLGLEKPGFIWLLVVGAYVGAFWGWMRGSALTDSESAVYKILERFSGDVFPPTIGLIRDLPDAGHLGFYAVMGRIYGLVGGDETQLRAVGLALVLAALFVFVRLALHFIYRNRLNPLWVSLGLLVLAVNPYTWKAAVTLDYMGLLLLLMLVSAYLFEKNLLFWSSVASSLAVLVDWRALLLASAFLITRIMGEKTKLIRAERIFAAILPFGIALLPLLAWQGVIPQGEAREWWTQYLAKGPIIKPAGLFYAMALLPLYSLFFSWAWGIRARSRALTIGVIWVALCIPLYFIFPVQSNLWSEVRFGTQTTMGYLDDLAILVAGPYKNLVIFVPWLAGTFLFMELLLLDVLDRSQWLRYFIVLFFASELFAFDGGDRAFLIVLPMILLLSLSEALVGEEGKLA